MACDKQGRAAVGDCIEEGDPASDARAFRRSLGQYATGVAVITAHGAGRPAGVSVNSFAAVSLDPPLVLWSIRRESYSLATFVDAGYFAVNVLAADQAELAARFAKPGDDKFRCANWARGQHGSPLIPGAIAQFECRLNQVVEGGDHLVLIGQVLRHARFEGQPLLFAQGRYATPTHAT